MSHYREALMSQHWAIHHSTCRQVKNLKKPILVRVYIEWGDLVAELETGERVPVTTATCCGKNFRVEVQEQYVWSYG